MTAPRRLVDGMNVIGSRPDGWWRDRGAAALRLTERLRRLAAEGEPVTLVLDGRPVEGLAAGEHEGVEVLYAERRGPDAADDRIVELVRERGSGGVRVVTSDRRLRERVQALGCEVEGAGALLRRLDELG